jgi:hypothetical protein
MRAHQPGSTPIDIPETVPNPAHTPAPARGPERPPRVPDKVPEQVIAPADSAWWPLRRELLPRRRFRIQGFLERLSFTASLQMRRRNHDDTISLGRSVSAYTERGKAYPLRLRLRLSENCRSIPVGPVDH